MVKNLTKSYVPDTGDIIWLEFTPHSGHEQGGKRPALVVSPAMYNRSTKCALVCPITRKVKGYPFEVLLHDKQKTTGAILADQVRNLDWESRHAKFIEKLSSALLAQVVGKFTTLLPDVIQTR